MQKKVKYLRMAFVEPTIYVPELKRTATLTATVLITTAKVFKSSYLLVSQRHLFVLHFKALLPQIFQKPPMCVKTTIVKTALNVKIRSTATLARVILTVKASYFSHKRHKVPLLLIITIVYL